jgi:CheY-like chemotaxis protein
LNSAARVINALSGLAWPLIVGLVLWRLFPTIKKIATSRGFTVKVGQTELTVQEVSEKLLMTTADIQGRLASITSGSDGSAEVQETLPRQLLERILWVDDIPANNAYEVAQLETLGVNVTQVTSTDEALAAMTRSRARFDAVISDMGRREEHDYNPDAGLDLIHQLRGKGVDYSGPIFVYASRRALGRRDEIIDAGGNGTTASPTELFALLREVGPFPVSSEQ